ncbi:MAG: enolase C-terminal domain-like protein, partial [Casimicrobiaceae bacterium]
MTLALTIRSLRSIAVDVPMARPLGTSARTIRSAPLLLIDLDTNEGITGRAYLFCYLRAAAIATARILEEIAEEIKGAPVAPREIGITLARHFRLIGTSGIVSMALSGVDMALWDALAIAADMPLARLLGATPRSIRAYDSRGLGLIEPAAAADEAEELVAEGFGAVKLRLGRPSADSDLAVVRAVRKRLPQAVQVMVD